VTPKRLLVAWIIVFTLWQVWDNRENRMRVDEIQQAREESCQRTYEGIREVFKPLFPPKPNPTQKESLKTFNDTIDDLKSQCDTQVQVHQ